MSVSPLFDLHNIICSDGLRAEIGNVVVGLLSVPSWSSCPSSHFIFSSVLCDYSRLNRII